MARKPRIHYPGAFYHVILRGNAGETVFEDNRDRYRFFSLLKEGIERFRHKIHAYCLMTNHIHLVIQVGEIPLSRIVQNFSFRFAKYINYRRNRSGHLFQGRYKAVMIDADSYLLELIRYIHNNPVRARMVESPGDYAWSSHNTYLGKNKVHWLTTDFVLTQFHNNENRAIFLFNTFVLKKKNNDKRKAFYKDFTDGQSVYETRSHKGTEIKIAEMKKDNIELDSLLRVVCELYGVSMDDLINSGKERRFSRIRSLTALIVRDMNGFSLTDLGKRLNRDASALSRAAIRLNKQLKNDPLLAAQIQNIKALMGSGMTFLY